jgi:hypothetical protein
MSTKVARALVLTHPAAALVALLVAAGYIVVRLLRLRRINSAPAEPPIGEPLVPGTLGHDEHGKGEIIELFDEAPGAKP